MKKVVFFLELVFSISLAIANDSIPAKQITYKVNITTAQGKYVDGFLNNISDSSLLVSTVPGLYGSTINRYKTELAYPSINQVQIKRKGSVGKGLLIGTIGGAALGAIIGLMTYKEPDCTYFCLDFGPGFSALTGASIGALGGAAIGGGIGGVAKKRFVIGGNKEKFDAMRTSVLQRVYGR